MPKFDCDLTTELKTRDGELMKGDNDKTITVGRAIVNALDNATEGEDKPLNGEQRYERYKLGLKLLNNNYRVSLDELEITIAKQVVGKAYPPLVVGQIFDAFEKPAKEPTG